jgi:hypothetical protein
MMNTAAQPNPKILIIGHGRHGKDTVAKIIQLFYGLSFQSSSEFCAKKLMFPALKDKYGYKTVEECYNDRANHRAEWYDIISNYCTEDPTQLSRDIFAEYDIYCGLRNKREFHAMKNQGVFDICIWVDRSDHLPLEPKDSMTLEPWMADFVIDNNGDEDELTLSVKTLMDHVMGKDIAVEDLGDLNVQSDAPPPTKNLSLKDVLAGINSV